MRFYIGSGMKNHDLVDAYAQRLKENGWEQTYCWTKCVGKDATLDILAEYAEKERKGVADADVVIILLPAGRGAHMELGMALALQKRVFLCAAAEEAFSRENTVSFYQLPGIVRLVGNCDENVSKIILC